MLAGMDNATPGLAGELAHLDRHGYVILERVLPRAELDALVAGLTPFEADRPMGRNDFEGERSQRVYSLAAKGEVFHAPRRAPAHSAHPRRRAAARDFLLSNLQSIRLHPGETAQPWHTDDAFYPVPRPRATLGVSTIWAIEDFTADNGATELIPGSHLWGMRAPRRPRRTRS